MAKLVIGEQSSLSFDKGESNFNVNHYDHSTNFISHDNGHLGLVSEKTNTSDKPIYRFVKMDSKMKITRFSLPFTVDRINNIYSIGSALLINMLDGHTIRRCKVELSVINKLLDYSKSLVTFTPE